jgi:hypothetical protein
MMGGSSAQKASPLSRLTRNSSANSPAHSPTAHSSPARSSPAHHRRSPMRLCQAGTSSHFAYQSLVRASQVEPPRNTTQFARCGYEHAKFEFEASGPPELSISAETYSNTKTVNWEPKFWLTRNESISPKHVVRMDHLIVAVAHQLKTTDPSAGKVEARYDTFATELMSILDELRFFVYVKHARAAVGTPATKRKMERPSYKTCQKILLRVMEANHDTDEEELPTGWGDDNGETVASTGDCGTDNMVAKQIGDLRAWKDAKTGQSDAEKLKKDRLQKELQRVEHCAQGSLSAGQADSPSIDEARRESIEAGQMMRQDGAQGGRGSTDNSGAAGQR